MSLKRIKVLVADDSSFMRLVLSDIINSNDELELVSTAADGKEAFQKTRQLKPDVLLLDLIMPEYDGLYAVKQIMQECPTPIVILSASSTADSSQVFDALNAGAYDFLSKPQGVFNSKIRDIEDKVVAKIKNAAAVNSSKLSKKGTTNNNYYHTFDKNLPYDILAIGASTGGTGAIEEVLKKLPGNFPLPIVIAQHMPPDFIESFAKRLDEQLPLVVRVVQEGEFLEAGVVYLVPGRVNTYVDRESVTGKVRVSFTEKRFPEFNHPSIDCLFTSIAEVYKERSIAIVLSGMGKDGTQGAKAIFNNKGFTIAQDEKTCVVASMPKSAVERGAIKKVLSMYEMGGYIVSCL